MLAVGLGQADTGELRQAVSGDNTQNVFYVRDAAQLDSLHSDLADALCVIARTQEASGTRAHCPPLCLTLITGCLHSFTAGFLQTTAKLRSEQ